MSDASRGLPPFTSMNRQSWFVFFCLLDIRNVYSVFTYFISCLQGKRKRKSAGSYNEDDIIEEVESSLGKIPKM